MKALLLMTLFISSAFARDLTVPYLDKYENARVILTPEDMISIQKTEVILIPGILSELFLKNIVPGISIITSEYFQAELDHLQELGFSVTRTPPSSFKLSEAREDIAKIFSMLEEKNTKGIFMPHSLGGILLLEHLLNNPDSQKRVAGIIFLQSPFHGSPIAEIFKYAPTDVVEYLKVSNREPMMAQRESEIRSLLKKIPVITVGTIANKSFTLFKPAVSVMKYGCLTPISGFCTTPRIFHGPYDLSDGMVPLTSSKLFDADNIILKAVDHGETVLDLPFPSISKKRMTEVLLKMLELKRREK